MPNVLRKINLNITITEEMEQKPLLNLSLFLTRDSHKQAPQVTKEGTSSQQCSLEAKQVKEKEEILTSIQPFEG